MTIPPYTSTLPTCQAWYFWKPEENFTGEPLWVFHDDGAYGADKTAPLRTSSALNSTPAELGGLWSGPIYDPDEDMDQQVTVAPTIDAAQCIWAEAWIGRCKESAVENGCCPKHQAKCSSCGNPATHDCDETGQFVCGAPLCNDCEHTTHEDGTNGGIGFNAQRLPEGMKSHCRKTEQRFKPWYSQNNPLDRP